MIYIQIMICELFLSCLHLFMLQLNITCCFSNILCVFWLLWGFSVHSSFESIKIFPSLRCPCQKSPISAHLPDSLINRCGFSPLPPCLSQYFDCACLLHFHNLTYYSYSYIGLFFHILQRMCRHLGCKPCDRITFAPSLPLTGYHTTMLHTRF